MKFVLIFVVLLSGFLAPLEAARKKDGPWPPFQVGVTGVMVRPTKETILPLTVAEITPGTPAEGKLQIDDVLLSVNGTKLDSRDPREMPSPVRKPRTGNLFSPSSGAAERKKLL